MSLLLGTGNFSAYEPGRVVSNATREIVIRMALGARIPSWPCATSDDRYLPPRMKARTLAEN